MTITQPLPHRSDLEQAVERAVAERAPVTAWPKVLRTAYAEDRRNAVRGELRHHQLIGLAITLLSIVFDLIALPENAARGAVLRVVLVIPVAVIAIAFARRMRLALLKLAVGYTVIAFAAIVVHLAGFADSATATRYTMSTTFLLRWR